MFDNFIIHTRELPDLTDEEREALGAFHDWQTKDFQRELRVYVVDDKKRLFAQFAPYGDTQDLAKFGPRELYGVIHFYSIVQVITSPDTDAVERWIEFQAYFDGGLLVKLVRVKKAKP